MKILVAEDDLTSRKILESLLKKLGHNPIITKNGREALEKFQEPNAPQLIILDWMMPQLNGLEVCEKIKSNSTNGLPYIIMLTMKNTKEDIVKGLEVGANDYLSKPYNPEELKARLNVGIRIIKMQHQLKEKVNQLEASESKYRNIIKNMQNVYFRTDIEGNLKMINPSGLNILGYQKADEILDKNIRSSLLHQPQITDKILKILKQKQKLRNIELKLKKKDDSVITVIANIAYLYDENHNVVGIEGTFSDITERKKAIAEKEKLQKQFHQAQKLETIGTLVGGIAHEFNNILTPILGYTELAKDLVENNPKLKNMIEQISDGSYKAKDLVEQILIFDRQEEQEKQPLNLKVIIKETAKFMQKSIPKSIKVDTVIKESAKVLADPAQIKQMIVNLCTNSFQAIGENPGKIKITINVLKPTKDFIKFHPGIEKERKYVQISIEDNGKGIDEAIINRIFEPFFTTKPVNIGDGLGLSVVHGIVKGHNGEITVESEKDVGTTFNIYLPVYISQKTEGNQKEINISKTKLGTILLIDDEESVLMYFKAVLQKFGYIVNAFKSGKKAISEFEKNKSNYSLILTDLSLPEISGLDLAKEMHKMNADIPIILVSGYGKEAEEKLKDRKIVKKVLHKPIRPKELIYEIKAFLK